jgi:anti-anti-sigma factor
MAAEATFPRWTGSLNGHRSVEVDLCGLTFMDSTGLRMLIDLQRQLSSENRQLRVRCLPQSQVQRLFEMAGLTDRFTLID